MDRQKMMRQAQILRRKRQARTVNTSPRISRGIIKLETPIPSTQYPNIELSSAADLRRKKAEELLKQRQQLIKKKASEQPKAPCGKCGRKKSQ